MARSKKKRRDLTLSSRAKPLDLLGVAWRLASAIHTHSITRSCQAAQRSMTRPWRNAAGFTGTTDLCKAVTQILEVPDGHPAQQSTAHQLDVVSLRAGRNVESLRVNRSPRHGGILALSLTPI